jgi:hypothetical protein
MAERPEVVRRTPDRERGNSAKKTGTNLLLGSNVPIGRAQLKCTSL